MAVLLYAVMPNPQPLPFGRKKIGALCIAVMVAGVIFTLYFRGDSDVTVLFVIPDNYRGIITLEEDERNGVVPERGEGNTNIYYVPDSGKLFVKSLELLSRYHFLKARHKNGTALPQEVSVSYIGAQSQGNTRTIFLSVGTFAEFRAHSAQVGFSF